MSSVVPPPTGRLPSKYASGRYLSSDLRMASSLSSTLGEFGGDLGLVVPELRQVEHLVASAEVRGEVRTEEPTDWASLNSRR